MSRKLKKHLTPEFVAEEGGITVALYDMYTADGLKVLVPARPYRDLNKTEKAQLRNIESCLGQLTSSDIAALFDDKERGMLFVKNNLSFALLELHNELNSTEEMKYFNVLASEATSYFYGDVIGKVHTTTVVSMLKDEECQQGRLINIMLEQSTNKAVMFDVDPELGIARPVSESVRLITTVQMMHYIMEDIMFRVALSKDEETLETIHDYLVPVEATVGLLVEKGEIKIG